MKKLKDGDLCSKVLKCDNGYVIAKLVAYTDKKETASNKKVLKEEKESKYFQKVYEKWTKKLDKKWSYEKNVDQKLWKQVKLNDADDSSEATTELKKQTKNETTEKRKRYANYIFANAITSPLHCNAFLSLYCLTRSALSHSFPTFSIASGM